MNKRFSAFLTALLLIAPSVLASCGAQPSQPKDTTASSQTTDETTKQEEYKYPYPASGYGGEEFNILNTSDMWTMHCAVDREEATGDVLDDAIFTRNSKIEEKFDIKLVETLTDNDYLYGNILNIARNSILSGDDEYDLMYLPMHLMSSMASDGMFNNLLDISSIQLDEKWWYSSFNDKMIINGALYGAYGGSNLMIQDAARVLTFNENLMENLKLELPYDLVREGKWTLDELNKYMAAAASLNGDDTTTWNKNGKTLYGLTNHGDNMVYYMVGCGEFNVENVDGDIKLTAGSAHWYDVVSKITNLFTLNDAKFLNGFNGTDSDPEQGGFIYVFMNQRTLFGVAEVNKFQGYRALEFDYGVVPFPKYDEKQDSYYSNTYEGATGAFIPVTSSDAEKVGLILDAMSYEGEKSVIPAFREIAVESKGLRNDESIEMLGIIMDSIIPRIGIMFDIDKSFQDTLNADMIQKTNTAASIVATNKTAMETKIKDLLENWNK